MMARGREKEKEKIKIQARILAEEKAKAIKIIPFSHHLNKEGENTAKICNSEIEMSAFMELEMSYSK